MDDDEVESVYSWRLTQLIELGIDVVTAENLAGRMEVDVGLARTLGEGGASPEQIVEIVA